jgi:hypothetical protein
MLVRQVTRKATQLTPVVAFFVYDALIRSIENPIW